VNFTIKIYYRFGRFFNYV